MCYCLNWYANKAGGWRSGYMGYSMSRLEIDSEMRDRRQITDGARTRERQHEQQLSPLDHEIAHQTKFRSAPSEMIRKVTPAKQKNMPISTVAMLSAREANYSGKGRFSKADGCHVLSRYLPVHGPWCVDTMESKAYVSQFSPDGTLFVAGFQGSHIRIYNVDNGWKVQKDILAKSLQWTVTDTALSLDQRYLVYSSLSPVVHIVNVTTASTESHANINEIHDGLDFSLDYDNREFSIFSVKFSTDGRELVAGTNDNDYAVYVYDLEANKANLRIPAHSCDVNTVSFADETGHVIYSGSDDKLCKVWDRRCFSARAAGVLTGHLEGITYLDSRGDGRCFISNGKDQTTKLWDIRKMTSNSTSVLFRSYEWDYRWDDYPSRARKLKHPCDQSLATYRGHSVLRTLIRCYFSPEYSTGQKYIYTGSHDGSVYIYDVVTGAQVAKLEYHNSTVRDCSWHPYYPMLVSSSWDCKIARWEFPGNGKVPVPAQKKTRRRQVY